MPLGSALHALALAMVLSLGGANQAAPSPPRLVAVTIDDLPVTTRIYRDDVATLERITDRLLEQIEAQGIPAIGFVNEGKLFVDGELDTVRVSLLRKWIRAGLELGNHTFSHPSLHKTQVEEFRQDVIRGEPVTRGLLEEAGRPLRFFRHPYLHTGRDAETRDATHEFLLGRGYTIAPVTIDNSEWVFAFAYEKALEAKDLELARRIGSAYVNYIDDCFEYYEQQSRALLGYELPQILLLHANALNADYFGKLGGRIVERGYRFIPLEQALLDPAYALEDSFFGPAGITWLHRWALTQGKEGAFFAGEPTVPDFVSRLMNDDD